MCTTGLICESFRFLVVIKVILIVLVISANIGFDSKKRRLWMNYPVYALFFYYISVLYSTVHDSEKVFPSKFRNVCSKLPSSEINLAESRFIP